MNGINLKFLNEKEPGVVPYLPYGVTTLEMKIAGDQQNLAGYIYPKNRSAGKNNYYVGYVDEDYDAKNFLVLWGGGRREGLKIDKESPSQRLFLQVLHQGGDISSPTITFEHSTTKLPVGTVKLEPAEKGSNSVRMKTNKEGDLYEFCLIGNRVPLYYSRWFPPRPSENKKTQYCHIKVPQISIKFKVEKDEVSRNVASDISIVMDGDKIAQISGDWRYSWPHAELFSVFGDSDYLVLRFWLYWIHENYSKSFWRGVDAPPNSFRSEDEQITRGLWESFSIEAPDIERFDFLIDTKKNLVSWVGTDFHYQEFWYMAKEVGPVKARIANDAETIKQVLKNMKNRIKPPKEDYNPMEFLKKILHEQNVGELKLEDIPEIVEYPVSNLGKRGDVTTRGGGFTRKHVPYITNGKTVAQLVSSIVTS